MASVITTLGSLHAFSLRALRAIPDPFDSAQGSCVGRYVFNSLRPLPLRRNPKRHEGQHCREVLQSH